MSSAKDYAFEIVSNANQSSATFIVRNKPSFFMRYLRLPVAFTLVACVVPSAITTLDALMETGWLAMLDLLDLLLDMDRLLLSRLNSAARNNTSAFLLLAATVGIVLLFSLQEASDTFTVMQDMGIQISSKSKWRFLNIGRHGKFLPISEIIDIVIHEGFHGYGQVIYYMCVLTRDKTTEGNGIQVIFPHFLPRKEILLQVWKLSRQMLYGKTRRHYRHVPGQGLTEVQHLHE